jgi:hypothetical protein
MKRVALAGIVLAVLLASGVVWIASGGDSSGRRTAALGVEPLAEGVSGVLRWRGGFDCAAQYEPLDVVVSDGSSFVARDAVGKCVQPPEAPWDLLARAGANGADGAQGAQGKTGPAGTFSGTSTSPDGRFTLSVTNAGISLKGPGASLEVDPTAVKIKADGTAKVDGATTEVRGAGTLKVTGGIVRLGGSAGCAPAAKVGDTVTGNTTIGSASLVNGRIATGSPTILVC